MKVNEWSFDSLKSFYILGFPTMPRNSTTISTSRTTVLPRLQTSTSKEENPLPLPPRDKNKTLLTAKPRHTRKHPLIIPPSSVQSALDKVNTVSPPHKSVPDEFINRVTEPLYTNNMVVQATEKNPESLHFEEQIESNLNALDEIHSDHDVVDGAEFKSDDDKVRKSFINLLSNFIFNFPDAHSPCELRRFTEICQYKTQFKNARQ